MFTTGGEIVIERAPEEVFLFVADFENDTLWCPEVASIARESGEKYAVGAVYHTEVGPKLFRESGGYEITRSEPPSRFEWTVWQGTSTGTGSYALEAAGDATRLRYQVAISLPGMQRLMAPFLRIYSKYIRVPRMLKNLKQELELDAGED